MPTISKMVVYNTTMSLEANISWLFQNFITHGEELVGMRLALGLLVYGNCNTQLKDINARIAKLQHIFLANERPNAPGQRYVDEAGTEFTVQEFVTRFYCENPLEHPSCMIISTIGTYIQLKNAYLISRT